MRPWRIGTRGSALARAQARIIVDALLAIDPAIDCEVVVIATAGDLQPEMAIGEGWPLGGFTSAIECSLLQGHIDLAVHSLKDLPTTLTSGLRIAAIPPREAAHDVLVARAAWASGQVPRGLRVGTSSPRRAAQLRRFLAADPAPMRGNVTTRLEKLATGDLDAIMLAAAGLRRLGLSPSNVIDLPTDSFLPAPGQGALAVQVLEGDAAALALARRLDDPASASAVGAERAFLAQIGAGCATPVAALARVDGAGVVHLQGQLFTEDGAAMVQAGDSGVDGAALGRTLATRLIRELERKR